MQYNTIVPRQIVKETSILIVVSDKPQLMILVIVMLDSYQYHLVLYSAHSAI